MKVRLQHNIFSLARCISLPQPIFIKGFIKGPANLTQSVGENEYDQKEYDALSKQVRELNNNSIVWD